VQRCGGALAFVAQRGGVAAPLFEYERANWQRLQRFARVELVVVDVQGRHVRTLQEAPRGPGTTIVVGESRAGVYFVRLLVDGASKASQRFTQVR
jgi:hypothetical protein